MPANHRGLWALQVFRAGLLAVVLTAAGLGTLSANPPAASETKLLPGDLTAGALAGRVSMSGNTILVGAYRCSHDSYASGTVHVLVNNGGGWVQEAELEASDAAPADLFGQAVSLDGDVALIGSFFDDDRGSHSGSAYVFRRALGVWSQEAKLVPTDGAEADMFGLAVSVHRGVGVVGAPWADVRGADSGAVYIYRWNASSWVEEAKLAPPDGAPGDLFGYSVWASGDLIVVGAPWADPKGPDSGAIYVFQWSGSAWVPQATLTASDGSRGDYLGFAISASGDTIVAGAFHEGLPKDRGAAYVFRWNGASWVQEAKLTASDASPWSSFGVAVAIDGDRAVVGAVLANGIRRGTGAAYVFQRSGATWTQTTKLFASDGAKEDYFGESVALSGTRVASAAPRDDDLGAYTGSAYVYELPAN